MDRRRKRGDEGGKRSTQPFADLELRFDKRPYLALQRYLVPEEGAAWNVNIHGTVPRAPFMKETVSSRTAVVVPQ